MTNKDAVLDELKNVRKSSKDKISRRGRNGYSIQRTQGYLGCVIETEPKDTIPSEARTVSVMVTYQFWKDWWDAPCDEVTE